jgi:hypothetical protein
MNRQHRAVWSIRFGAGALAAVLTVTGVATPATAGIRQNTAAAPDGKVNPDAEALAAFRSRLEKYVALRQQLASKLKPLSPTPSAADLTARQESLAAALSDVRKGARQGDIIPPRVAELIRRTVVADFNHRPAAARRAVFEEVPERIRPAVNKTLPDEAALATVPPLLLNNLPRLPDNLQYRFIGRDVILLDGDTRLMIDYISNVFPSK